MSGDSDFEAVRVDGYFKEVLAIRQVPSSARLRQRLDPGIGHVVAFSLLADMPELGNISSQQAAALLGVAPFNRESGTYKGQRKIRGGRYQVRTVMLWR